MRPIAKRKTKFNKPSTFKVACSFLVLLLLILQVQLWFGSANPLKIWRLHKAVAERQQINQDWQNRNQRLLAEIHNLKTGANVVEAHARMNLGMIKNGEIYYQIVS
jgi:cell division protein FtsB